MAARAPRRVIAAFALVFAAALAWDLARPPARQLSAAVLLAGIDLYQEQISGRLGEAGVRCRFEPTCSVYAETVIRRDGALVGSWKALRRLARCGPWTPAGTPDLP